MKSLMASKVFVAEQRPGLEGMKQVSESLLKNKIQPVVICDNMMAFCMERGLVESVHIFAYALNRTTALCRTGSLIAAICAHAHEIPVVLHPSVKQDKQKASHLLRIGGRKVTDAKIKTYVPTEEEVPMALITTVEKG